MKFSCNKADLVAAVERARRVTPVKSAKASTYARLVASSGAVIIRATDLDLYVAARVDADVSRQGEVAVLPGDFVKVLRHMPDTSRLSFTADEGRMKVTAEGSKRSFQLAYVDTADLPAFKATSEGAGFKISGELLAEHIKRVSPAAYEGDDRINMQGVAFDLSKSPLRLVATDGQHIHISDVDVPFEAVTGTHLLYIESAKLIASEIGNMGEMTVIIDDRGFSVSNANVEFFARHMSAPFPDYEYVYSRIKSETSLTLDVRTMIEALSAMAAVDTMTKFVVTETGVELFARGERDTAEDEIECAVCGPCGTVYLNTKFALEALRGCPTPEVEFQFNGPVDPTVFIAPVYRVVVMPMNPPEKKR